MEYIKDIKDIKLEDYAYDADNKRFMLWNKYKAIWVDEGEDYFDGNLMVQISLLNSKYNDPRLERNSTKIMMKQEIKQEIKLRCWVKEFDMNSKLIPTKNNRILDTETGEVRERSKQDYFTYALNVNYTDTIFKSELVVNYVKEMKLDGLLKPLYLSLIRDQYRSHMIVFRETPSSGLSTLLKIILHMFEPCWKVKNGIINKSNVTCCIIAKDTNFDVDINFRTNYCIITNEEVPKLSCIHVIELPPLKNVDPDFFDKWKQKDFDYLFQLIINAGTI
jgi:hypothetical protein